MAYIKNVILSAVSSLAVYAQAASQTEVLYRQKTLLVRTTDSLGSGVYLRPGKVLTAAHVCSSGVTAVIDFRGGTHIVTQQILPSSPVIDLCLLQVPSLRLSKAHSTTLARMEDNEIGAEVIYTGFPFGSYAIRYARIIEEWILSGEFYGDPSRGFFYQRLDNVVQGGNSGGPAFDKRTGRLLGIVVISRQDRVNIEGLTVPAGVIREFMTYANTKKP